MAALRSKVMRCVWRVWLRPGCCKSVIFISFFIFGVIVVTQIPVRLQVPSEVVVRDISVSDKVQVHLSQDDPILQTTSVEDDPISHPLGDWLMVQNSNRELFLYSAYLDRRRSSHHVRIIGIVKRKKKVTHCELTYGNETQRVTGKVKIIRENWNLLYSAAYILCDIQSDSKTPETVAVVENNIVDKSSTIPIQVFAERAHHGNMSVCVKPFHYEYNRAVWLLEFIEFYQLLGADHFIFYNHTVGPDVQEILQHYEQEGVVTVLPWALPVQSQKEIRTEGIFAALNDCSYRSISRFDFSAMVDVDEFLIPRGSSQLTELMKSLGVYDVYVFQNVFYYLYWENDTAVHDALFSGVQENSLGATLFGEDALVPYLLTAFKTRRLSKIHKPGTRSKYIVRPENVVEVGNHNVWDHVGPKRVINVPTNKGLSHHYRICEFGGFDCLKDHNQIDRAAHVWLIPLVKRVAEKCKLIFPKLGRCPEAPPLGSPW